MLKSAHTLNNVLQHYREINTLTKTCWNISKKSFSQETLDHPQQWQINHSKVPIHEAPGSNFQGAPNEVKDETGGGKVVHSPGSERKIVRSELYGMKVYLEEGPRDHLQEDGTTGKTAFKWVHTMRDVQPQKFVNVDGQTYIIGVPDKPMEELYWDAPFNKKWWQGVFNNPFKARRRMNIFSNYDFIMKTDYCMFWIPTFIVFSITIPTYCMAYMIDELAYTSMTVKVIGRQWYWVYEVESPTDDDNEEDDEE